MVFESVCHLVAGCREGIILDGVRRREGKDSVVARAVGWRGGMTRVGEVVLSRSDPELVISSRRREGGRTIRSDWLSGKEVDDEAEAER